MDLQVWARAQESAYLASSMVILMLLVIGFHFEKHFSTMYERLVGAENEISWEERNHKGENRRMQ